MESLRREELARFGVAFFQRSGVEIGAFVAKACHFADLAGRLCAHDFGAAVRGGRGAGIRVATPQRVIDDLCACN